MRERDRRREIEGVKNIKMNELITENTKREIIDFNFEGKTWNL